MKNQWRIVLGLVLTLLIVIFSVINTMTVKINFGIAEISAPLIIVVIGSAMIGAMIIALVTTGTIWQQKREMKQLRKEIKDWNEKLDKKVADKKAELEREYQNKVIELETSLEKNQTILPEENTDWQG